MLYGRLLGAATRQAITDVGGGKLIASLNDADRNVIGLLRSPRSRVAALDARDPLPHHRRGVPRERA